MVLLIHDLRVGGAERVVVTLANHLERFEPVIALVRPQQELRGELAAGVRVVDLATRGAGLIALVSKARRLRRLVDEAGCALVCTFLHKSHIIALAARMLVPRLKVVINVHELVSQHLVLHHPPAQRMLLRWFTRWCFPRADLVVAVAEAVKRDLVERFGVPANRVQVLHNPLDLELIRRRAAEPLPPDWAPPAGAGPLIVAVGRLVRLKAFDVLVHSLAHLSAYPSATLVIVGDGPERDRLALLSRELGIADRVLLTGLRANPWQYMARADVVALSSRSEAFPSVLGEAMALGRPVVATACSDGVRELLEDGHSGILVPPGDAPAMARALQALLDDAQLRLRLGEAGRRRVADLSAAEAVRRYEAALGSVLGLRITRRTT